MSRPDSEPLITYNQSIAEEFRANAGKVGGPFDGNELLLLTTTGARSGQPRVSPLSCKRADGRLLVIAGFGGLDVNPAWVYNLRADPRAHVERGTESFDVTAHELTAEEREALLPTIIEAVPHLREFQSKTSRVIPIFELTPQ